MDIPELAATRSSVVGQRLLVWTGPLLMVVFFLGFWVIGGFLPPPSPMRTPNQVVAFFINHWSETNRPVSGEFRRRTRLHLECGRQRTAQTDRGPHRAATLVSSKR